MPNDKRWQQRSDEWVKATQESRKRKEALRRERRGGGGSQQQRGRR